MRHLILLTSAVAIALTVPGAAQANIRATGVAMPDTSPGPVVRVHDGLGAFCHKQLANDGGIQIISQNFEAARDSWDSRGADDFTLTRPCTVTEVDVIGEYSQSGPPDSVHVSFYRDVAGSPGGVRNNERHLAYADPSGTGNLHIPLRRPVTFPAGTYWVGVQVNMDYTLHGGWYWHENSTAIGANAKWRNPADGFGTGCTTWTDLAACDSGQAPDFAFALLR